jgi:hypothetical protein
LGALLYGEEAIEDLTKGDDDSIYSPFQPKEAIQTFNSLQVQGVVLDEEPFQSVIAPPQPETSTG